MAQSWSPNHGDLSSRGIRGRNYKHAGERTYSSDSSNDDTVAHYVNACPLNLR